MADTTIDLRMLVPLDGSDLATVSLPFVRTLATRSTALTLLRVVPDPTPLTPLVGSDDERLDAMVWRAMDEATRYLNDAAAILTNETEHLRMLVKVGNPDEVIERVAAENAVDLIVMGTHGRGAFGRAMIGSIADRVARSSVVPVMLVHPHERDIPARSHKVGNVRRLIVPLDGSAFARQALPVAERIARLLEIPVHLVHAIDLEGDWLLGDEDNDLEMLLAPMREELAAWLHDEVQALHDAGLEATSQLELGRVAHVIADGMEPGDVIVMTSHGASGLRRWLLGSVAEKLIRSGIAPVVLVPVAERVSSESLPDVAAAQATV